MKFLVPRPNKEHPQNAFTAKVSRRRGKKETSARRLLRRSYLCHSIPCMEFAVGFPIPVVGLSAKLEVEYKAQETHGILVCRESTSTQAGKNPALGFSVCPPLSGTRSDVQC